MLHETWKNRVNKISPQDTQAWFKKRYNWSRDRLKSFQFIKIYNKLLVLS